MIKYGWEGTGIDISREMIKIAKAKGRKMGIRCNLIIQDLKNIILPTTFHLATCNFDTINYILNNKDLLIHFQNIVRLLKPNGYYIFDIITPYQCKRFSGKFIKKFNDFELKMSTSYNRNKKIKKIELEIIFEKRKCKEIHYQKCYEVAEMVELLKKSGLIIRNIWDIEKKTGRDISPNTTRAFFITQKL